MGKPDVNVLIPNIDVILPVPNTNGVFEVGFSLVPLVVVDVVEKNEGGLVVVSAVGNVDKFANRGLVGVVVACNALVTVGWEVGVEN